MRALLLLLVPIVIMASSAAVVLRSEMLEVREPSKEVREIISQLASEEGTKEIAGALLDAHKDSLKKFVADANSERKSTTFSLLWILALGTLVMVAIIIIVSIKLSRQLDKISQKLDKEAHQTLQTTADLDRDSRSISSGVASQSHSISQISTALGAINT